MSILSNRAAALAVAMLCVGLAGCSAASGANGDIAAVNGQKISRATLDTKLEASQAGASTLNQLIQESLVDQYGKDNHIDVPGSEIDKKEADIKSKMQPGQFDSILKQQALTEADVRNILREQIIIEKSVGKDIKVGDAEIKSYFDKNHALLDKPEQVRARHILVADKPTADKVESELKSGKKFEDLAKQYSTDPSTKDKGGELGFFGKGQMVPAFQTYAFSGKVGAISPPVKSPFGWHVIQVEEKKPALKATLASSRDQIKQQLVQQQQAQQIPVFIQSLRSKAKIEVYDDRLRDKVNPPGTPGGTAATSQPAAGGSPAPAASAK